MGTFIKTNSLTSKFPNKLNFTIGEVDRRYKDHTQRPYSREDGKMRSGGGWSKDKKSGYID